jgi:hypothetical protein
MKETNKYRIVKLMGIYHIQRKCLTIFKKEIWAYELELIIVPALESYRRRRKFNTAIAAEHWLRDKIAKEKAGAELKARGIVVVKEIEI